MPPLAALSPTAESAPCTRRGLITPFCFLNTCEAGGSQRLQVAGSFLTSPSMTPPSSILCSARRRHALLPLGSRKRPGTKLGRAIPS
jgi:hypothetical protein